MVIYLPQEQDGSNIATNGFNSAFVENTNILRE